MSEPRRIKSIDIFRGITISLMIVVNNPGSWSNVYGPLLHAKWHGCTLTDLVFPFFIFLMGASMRFAFVKWHYFPSGKFYKHILRRTLSIFIVGILLNAYPFIRQDWDWSNFRILGVLQRIALTYGISACLIIKYDFKQMTKILVGILASYWAILLIGSPNDPYSLEMNIVRKLDILILGENHLYSGYGLKFDPEGLLSTIPCIGTLIIGYLMGGMLHTTKNFSDCSKRMFMFGSIIAGIGYAWGFILPLNKALWTSSYVLYTGGVAAIILSIITFCVDIKKWKKPFWFFEVFGTNSIFLFIVSGLWTKTILKIQMDFNGKSITAYSYLYRTMFEPVVGELNGSLLFAISHFIVFWLLLYWMYKKDIRIKL